MSSITDALQVLPKSVSMGIQYIRWKNEPVYMPLITIIYGAAGMLTMRKSK
jgi:hypothetical protein